jgi:Protein of unknown function (DUF3221)
VHTLARHINRVFRASLLTSGPLVIGVTNDGVAEVRETKPPNKWWRACYACFALAKRGGGLFRFKGGGAIFFKRSWTNVFLMKLGRQADGLPSANASRHFLRLARARATALGVILLCAAAALATDVRGKITSISVSATDPALGTVLIEGKVEKDTSVDKASTRVTAKTSIFRMEGGKKVAGKFSDLKVGQTVEASFTGPVAESYPVQGAASEIVILQTR